MVSDISTICVIAGLDEVRTNQERFEKDGIDVFFSIVPNDTDGLSSILQYAFIEKPEMTFGIIIDFRDIGDVVKNSVAWTDMFCSLLLHPEYRKINGEIMVGFLNRETNADARIFINELEGAIRSQGFLNLQMINIANTHKSFNTLNGLLFIDERMLESDTGFYDYYITKLVSSEVPLSLLIDYEQPVLKMLTRRRQEAEKQLFEKEKHLIEIIKLHHTKSALIAKVVHEKLQTEEALRSKTEYLDFLLKKSTISDADGLQFNEVILIKRFYNNEYEILPLWYKRFGHVLKALSGKRTFRSLFNKNAKKYKD
jgi:hypothetical protein